MIRRVGLFLGACILLSGLVIRCAQVQRIETQNPYTTVDAGR